LQKSLRNLPLQNPGIFNKINEFFKKSIRAVGLPLCGFSPLIDRRSDQARSFIAIHQNPSLLEGFDVLIRRRNTQLLVAMETMATAEAVASNHGVCSRHLHIDHIVAMERHQPTNGPTEPLSPRPPSHKATTLQCINPRWDEVAKERHTVASCRQHSGEDTRTFGCIALLELRCIDAAAFGEANRCGAWNTIFESLSNRRTFSLFTEIGLTVVQVGDRHH
jgi:hypothetical protein